MIVNDCIMLLSSAVSIMSAMCSNERVHVQNIFLEMQEYKKVGSIGLTLIF